MRPIRLDDIVGQKHLLGPGKPLRRLIEADRLSSVVLWGPAGTGKTTLARVVARSTAKTFVQLSAVTATVKDVREEIARAKQRLGEREQATILFLDEVHRFNKAQQDSLLPAVESGLIVLIGATTENPYFEVNAPLLSRSTLFRLEPLDSIRGSDPDAAVYWLARMLEAGEDARFIARRLMVHASEDIGMADSQALLVAAAAAQAVEFVGLPEARINLAHATVYLATAPKSNRAYESINKAQTAARTGGGEVGTHLRDAHYSGAASLGHGEGYRYPHKDPRGWVPQDYLPAELAGQKFYEPTRLGDEAEIADRLDQIQRWRDEAQR
ncbi:UNVERIFIED_CONTAM: hypothetical protein GTU68_046273 [Idotea baltica]|nr:hypothetical protein [Idotea baltica]